MFFQSTETPQFINTMKRILTDTKVSTVTKRLKRSFRTFKTHPNGLGPKKTPVPWPIIGNCSKTTLWIDESGCGCYAGPLTIGITFINNPDKVELIQTKTGIHDSKLLKPYERDAIYSQIIDQKDDPDPAFIYHIESISSKTLDEMGGKQLAWKYGIRQAIQHILAKIKKHDPSINITSAVLDGRTTVEKTKVPIITTIKADQKYIGVSCASILAKVNRDLYMIDNAHKYPEFEDIFKNGKGYRYKPAHDELIKRGIYTDLHRKSYNPLRTYLLNK